MSIFKISPSVQKYDWGKHGSSSKVAQLVATSQSIDEEQPYAELWMGTHPTAPSIVTGEGKTLKEVLKSRPDLIGARMASIFESDGAKDGNLPFLFKVLSIGKALSIQAHPDKQTAEQLHAQRPDVYKDANHKPELALALTPFEALCGFLPLKTIANNLNNTPELAVLAPHLIMRNFIKRAHAPKDPATTDALRELFKAIMTAEPFIYRSQLDTLIRRYTSHPPPDAPVQLVLLLNSQFPGDIGVFCAFLLNHVMLEPGQAIFLGAGEPHAYVSGDIIECMANSDNVIRAGLTPKYRDVQNLVTGLTYRAGNWKERFLVEPVKFSEHSLLYDTHIPDFRVVSVQIKAGAEEKHDAAGGPSIVIVLEGKGRAGDLEIAAGDVFFIGADAPVTYVAEDNMVLYRALAN